LGSGEINCEVIDVKMKAIGSEPSKELMRNIGTRKQTKLKYRVLSVYVDQQAFVRCL